MKSIIKIREKLNIKKNDLIQYLDILESPKRGRFKIELS